jgi:hypothetical protein
MQLPNATASTFPALHPNRMTLDAASAAGARPRVIGRTALAGRPATRLELVSELPDGPGASKVAGVPARAPGDAADLVHFSSTSDSTSMPQA